MKTKLLRQPERLEDRVTPTGTPLVDSWIRGLTTEPAQVINGYAVAASPSTT